jgi:hypothetical protein
MEGFPKTEEQKELRSVERYGVKDVEKFETSRGSVYTFLDDGRVSRFKTKTNEQMDPQDIIVFIPDFDFLKEILDSDILSKIGRDEEEVSETILAYIHGQQGDKHVYIVNEKGEFVKNQEDLQKAQKLALVLLDQKDGEIHRYAAMPVSRRPRIGFSTFDMSFYKNDKGEERVRRHLGNTVTKIKLRSGIEIE